MCRDLDAVRLGRQKSPRRNRHPSDELGSAFHWAGIPKDLVSQIAMDMSRTFLRRKMQEIGADRVKNTGLMKNKKFLKLTLSELRLPISSTLHTPLTCRIAFSRICDPAFCKVHCDKSFGIEIRIHYQFKH